MQADQFGADGQAIDAALHLGHRLLAQRRPLDAISCFDRIIALQPGHLAALCGRANAFFDLGRFAEAVADYDDTIARRPDVASLYYNRGNAFFGMKRFAEAVADFDRAIAGDDGYAPAHVGRGNALGQLRQFDSALASYDRAISLEPDNAKMHSNRGNALMDLGRPEEALRSFDRAAALNPGSGAIGFNKAICLLAMGRLAEGWALYESRRTREQRPLRLPQSRGLEWTGDQDLAGKVLLLHAEQGLGDTIQFCRYALLAAARGARVILSVPGNLVTLMKGLGPQITVIEDSVPAPVCDYHALLLSMPLKTGMAVVAADTPYLHAEPDRVAAWAARIGTDGFKVGIAWQGERQWRSEEKAIDIGRSFPLTHYAGLVKIPGIRLISLQKHDGTEQLATMPAGMNVESLGKDFDAGADSFLDTAAVMQHLNLVITSDTAVAHLAGALGRPVWVALKYAPDWRWQRGREDSPWYSTMRLFRQVRDGDWDEVFDRIADALAKFSGAAGKI